MSFDPAVVREWLYTTLTADSQLMTDLPGGFHHGTAPKLLGYPFGSFQLQAPGQDTTSISRRRILSNGLWLVRGIGVVGDSDQNLDRIAGRIDDVIDRASGSAGAGFVYMATREAPWMPPPYLEEGIKFAEAGGLYRIWVQDPLG